MERPTISILDSTPIGPGMSARDAVGATLQVAQEAERLGCHRFWVVEHHCNPQIGGTSPAVMLARVGAMTARIRIGAGGVMLPNHAPLVVAEQFCTLSALHPDRIDLGIGRASGAEQATVEALRGSSKPSPGFEQDLDELHGVLQGNLAAGHPRASVALSLQVSPPPMFVLGSGAGSAPIAGTRGLPYAFAHHLNPKFTGGSVREYRDTFQPRNAGSVPYVIVTASIVCAAERAVAERAALDAAVMRLRTKQQAIGSPPLREREETDLATRMLTANQVVIGNPREVLERLAELANDLQVDELMLASIEYEGADRLRTMQSLLSAPEAAGCFRLIH